MSTTETKQPDNSLNRREFLLNLGTLGGLAVAAVGSLIYGLRFVLPAITPEEVRRVRVTGLTELPEGKAAITTIAGVSFALVHRNGTVRAFSAVCTHLGCQVQWEADDEQFFCPCHLGYFDADGQVVSGPPPRALDAYDVEIDGNNVYVMLPKPAEGGIE
jgi:cytochrome b6-f complex iron-sulfur subunit